MATMFPTVLYPNATGNMTGTSDAISKVIDVRNSYAMAIQLYWSGSGGGAIVIEGSMNYQINPQGGNVLNEGTWDDLGITPENEPAGVDGHTLIDITATGIAWVRVRYTNVTGSGTLTGIAATKG